MSIITTVYTERLTITTDDDGNVTMQRTSSADTHSAFYFDELSKEAQDRAISDAIEEERNDYYQCGTGHTAWNIEEICDAYNDLAKHQPLRYHDHYSSFYLTVEDPERVTPESNNGICWSMDICEAWNRYAAAVPMLIEEAEDHEATADELTAPYYWPHCIADHEPMSVLVWSKAHGDYADRCRWKAEELAEKAKDALESELQRLIEETEDYYQSAEFWREWLNDGETRFTRDGERI